MGEGNLNVSILHELLNEVASEVDQQYAAPAALKARLKSIAGDFEATGEEVGKVEARIPDEGDSCPICYEDLLDDTKLVHCGYGCGKAVHEACFSRYSKAHLERYNSNEVFDTKLKCVTCRTDWVVEPVSALGSRGMLVGRRAIDLAEEMPEQFEAPRPSRPSARSKAKSKVVRGRVSKSKTATARPTSTSGRRSARLAAHVNQEGSTVVATKGRKRAALNTLPRKKSGKAVTSKKVTKTKGIAKPTKAASTRARAARLARRSGTRLTRSMTL